MLTKRIIPCLDVHQGRVVKGVNFLNLKDAGDPTVLADFYDKEGADELVFLDITASSDGRDIMIDVVKNVSENVFIPLTVGGGIRSIKDIRSLLQAGADKVSLNTSVILEPKLISQSSRMFGSQCIVVAIDYKKITDFKESNQDKGIGLDLDSKWEVYTHGGRNRTGIDALKWAECVSDLGCGELLLTSMDMDGKQQGYDIEYISSVNEKVNVQLKDYRDKPIIKLLWKAISAYMEHYKIKILFGCASFPGINYKKYKEQLSFLYHYHLAPESIRPKALLPNKIQLNYCEKKALNNYEIFKSLPPLLKGYLRLGARVSDGAFIDKQFNTIDICIVLKSTFLKKNYINFHKKRQKDSKIIFLKNFLKNKSRFIK